MYTCRVNCKCTSVIYGFCLLAGNFENCAEFTDRLEHSVHILRRSRIYHLKTVSSGISVNVFHQNIQVLEILVGVLVAEVASHG